MCICYVFFFLNSLYGLHGSKFVEITYLWCGFLLLPRFSALPLFTNTQVWTVQEFSLCILRILFNFNSSFIIIIIFNGYTLHYWNYFNADVISPFLQPLYTVFLKFFFYFKKLDFFIRSIKIKRAFVNFPNATIKIRILKLPHIKHYHYMIAVNHTDTTKLYPLQSLFF